MASNPMASNPMASNPMETRASLGMNSRIKCMDNLTKGTTNSRTRELNSRFTGNLYMANLLSLNKL